MNTVVAVPFSVHCLATVNNSLIKPIRRQSACCDVTGHVTPLLPVPMATAGEVTMYSCILCDVYYWRTTGRKVTFKLVAFFYICATVINCPPPSDHCLQGTKGRTLFWYIVFVTFHALPVVSFRRRTKWALLVFIN